MFDRLFKRPYYANRHINAPFLKERTQYLQQHLDRGCAIFYYVGRCYLYFHISLFQKQFFLYAESRCVSAKPDKTFCFFASHS